MLNTGLTACKVLALRLSDVQEVEQVGTLRFNDGTATSTSKKKDKTKQSKKQTNKQQQQQKNSGFNKQTTTLHAHHTFLYNSLPFLHDYDVKMANYAFCGERKQATTKFYFSF